MSIFLYFRCIIVLQMIKLHGPIISIIIIIIYTLTARVIGAPQMISQPVSSIQFPPFFPVFHCPLRLCELQACPFPNVVFLPLPLSALSSSPFHCTLQDGSGQTWWTGNMTIPLQCVSLYDGQEVFVWTSCQLDLGTDFLVGNMVFVWDVYYLAVAPHFHDLYSSTITFCCTNAQGGQLWL